MKGSTLSKRKNTAQRHLVQDTVGKKPGGGRPRHRTQLGQGKTFVGRLPKVTQTKKEQKKGDRDDHSMYSE